MSETSDETPEDPPAWPPLMTPPAAEPAAEPSAEPAGTGRRGPTRRDVVQGVAGGSVLLLAVLGVASLVPSGDGGAATVRTAASASPTPTGTVRPTPTTTPTARVTTAPVPEPVDEPVEAETRPATGSPLPVPVLDHAAVRACGVYTGAVGDVVTEQDRSDLARAVNAWARQSAEAQLVSAGQDLTAHADSLTGFWWAVAKAGFADVCRRGAAAAVAAGSGAGAQPAPQEPAVDGTDDEAADPEPALEDEVVPEEETDDPSGDCLPVGPVFLERIPSRPADGVGELVLPSAWAVQGERGSVVGGYLSSADGGGEVDGEFGAWFLTGDDVYAYSDAALTRTGWPVADGGDAAARVAAVRSCAEDSTG